jgi:phage terminase large subunit GpA-like protein
MDAINDPVIEALTFMKSAQIGGTEIINNIIAYFIHQDPSPILVINPTLDMAKTWSKDRFAPMVRDSPVLRDIVSDQRLMRKTGNTILHKAFPGGHITMAGANSPASLDGRPIRIVLFDDIDRFGNTKEGDPVELGAKRTQSFWNRKIIYVSTPTVDGMSQIQEKFEHSDQRFYFVPCPKCGYFQKLVWAGIKWENEDHKSVWYECEGCHAKLTERDKAKMIRRGEWRATHPEVEGHAGFHISELYSSWSTWKEIVRKFHDAKSNPEKLRVWINTCLGEVWRDQQSYQISSEGLQARCEEYEDVPSSVLILTASVDVQDDRLEVLVKGWGLGDESWFIAKKVFHGSPGRGDTWQLTRDYLVQPFKHESGLTLFIQAVCIDSGGHFTQAVYQFCKKNQDRRFFAVKGLGGYGKLFIGKSSRNNKQRAVLYPLGVDTAKELIYDRLSNDEEGPGYMHFNKQCDEEYFRQLTAEKQVTKYNKGFPTRVWMKKEGQRNEALDLEVYALAAYTLLNADMKAIFKRMISVIEKLEKETKTPEVEQQGESRSRTSMSAVKRKNWVNNY